MHSQVALLEGKVALLVQQVSVFRNARTASPLRAFPCSAQLALLLRGVPCTVTDVM